MEPNVFFFFCFHFRVHLEEMGRMGSRGGPVRRFVLAVTNLRTGSSLREETDLDKTNQKFGLASVFQQD